MHVSDLLGKLWPVLLLVLIAGIAAAVLPKRGGAKEKPVAKNPLTDREQAMFFRLQQVFPDHVVMPQVAFSALLNAKTVSSRNTFDRKVADFVLCTKAFAVVCVIELDDASHKNKRAADAARERLLTDAGYRVLRFKNVPNIDEAKNALAKISTTTTQNSSIIRLTSGN
jgi:very-short-patch-repair endonuclease